MAPTPSSKTNHAQATQMKTPNSKHRLHFNAGKVTNPSPNPHSVAKETAPAEHPVEVIGRIRDYPDRKDKPVSILQINPDRQTLRVRTDIGYRDFSLDGVSLSEEEDIDGFYKKFVQSRINGVKLGDKCTVMMYGPTGSGKSHTMFGCSKQPGIVYRSLKDILGGADEENDGNGQRVGVGTFVQVTVLEIYNEEIYDLLSSNNGGGLNLGWAKNGSSKKYFQDFLTENGGGLNLGWAKSGSSKVRLEVMGKKAKNATFISGTEAGKISKEIQKVEKRRIVKSTLCNDRSSRSHCMIILDVPTVGGRLMLVDMAGSENIEQAGQTGLEAKMQTGKINQGNIALKRVVESIANGDSHVPFRDSKLTMLLQDSFEDDKSKILMILCASPDPKEIHKTISTLEYGAKAKCIVRGPHTPVNDKVGTEDSSSAVILGSRIAAMDQFIYKLQMETKLREKERNEAHTALLKKEEEVAALRAKLELMEGKESGISEEVINLKVNERTQFLKLELEKKLQECQKMANEFVELGRKRMEEKILQQQQEVEMLRFRLEEIECELSLSRSINGKVFASRDLEGNGFAKKLLEIYADEDPGMVKSMDLDMGDQEPYVRDVRHIDRGVHQLNNNVNQGFLNHLHQNILNEEVDDDDVFAAKYGDRVCLSTVFEEEEAEEEEEHKGNLEEEEVMKEIIEEKTVCSGRMIDGSGLRINFNTGSFASSPQNLEKLVGSGPISEPENDKDTASSRRKRIQNIFTLCGNYRELSHHSHHTKGAPGKCETFDPQSSPEKKTGDDSAMTTLPEELLQVQKSGSLPDDQIPCDVTVKGIRECTHPTPPVETFGMVKLGNEQKLIEAQMNRNRASDDMALASKENNNPVNEDTGAITEVYVKWEASKENPGKFITTLKVLRDSSLADLRKLIEVHLGEDKQQAFTFLVLGDPTGAPVPREKEATVRTSKLPICNNQIRGHLACLRPVKGIQSPAHHLPLSPLENRLPLTPNSCFMQQGDGFSPQVAQHLTPTPFINMRKRY